MGRNESDHRAGLRRPAAGDAGRRGRLRRGRARRRRPTGSSASPPASRTSRTSPTTGSAAPGHRPLPRRPTDYADARRLRHRASITVPTPLRDGAPDLQLHRGGGAARSARTCGRVPRWSSSRPPTRAPPRSWSRPLLEDGSRPQRRRTTSTSATAPSASTRATRHWHLENTPKVVSGIDAASLAAVRRRSTTASSTRTVPVLRPAGGRADQAAREHLPARQHRAGQRAGDVRRPTSASTSGRPSTPRRPSRSASCAFTPGPGVGGHCLPIDPRYLSWQVKRTLGQQLPVRRAGQRRQRPHARLRGAAPHRRRSTGAARPVNGSRILLLGPGVQAQHRRRPGVAGARVVAELLARPRRRRRTRSTRTSQRDASIPSGVAVVDADAERARAPPTPSCCSPTTTPSTTTSSCRHARYVLDTRDRCHGDAVERL